MKVKVIIFDFDGTLADTYQWFLKASEEASEIFQFKKVSDVESLRKLETREILKALGIRWWKMPKIAAFMKKRMVKDLPTLSLFPGTSELLKDLRLQGIKIGVVSSNSQENIQRILSPKLSAHIDVFACGATVFGKKRKFREILKKLRVAPAEVICVGDETRDIDAAKSIGARSAAVAWGYGHVDTLTAKKPDYILRTWDDLRSIVMPRR